METPRLFTAEEKSQLAYLIVKEILNGKNISQASENVGINKDTVYSWIKRNSPEGRLIKNAIDNTSSSEPIKTTKPTEPTVEETMEEKIQRLLIPSPTVSAPKLDSNFGPEERVCLILSDLHIGRRTPSFDSHVYTDRLSQLYEAVDNIVRMHRNDSALRIIHVFDAGDNVHGERVGQQGRMNDFEFGIPEQLAISTSVMGELIDKLLGIFDEVHWHDAPGNHGNLDKI